MVMKSSALAQRIGQRLIDEGKAPTGFDPKTCVIWRTRAGREQRSHGAWSWFIRYQDAEGKEQVGPELGSQWPASEVIGWPEWNIYKGSIDPC